MASDNPYRRRAERHEGRARNYLQKAEMLLYQYDDPDSAGALMYEAAKQCVNAVANQRGSNPGTIGGKMHALRSLQSERTDYPNLAKRWRYADKLHIHADRGLLTASQYMEAWDGARAFIGDMLAIYAAA